MTAATWGSRAARWSRAHVASPDEKAELWPRITRIYKGYEQYQRNTSRDIPVVVCEPRSA